MHRLFDARVVASIVSSDVKLACLGHAKLLVPSLALLVVESSGCLIRVEAMSASRCCNIRLKFSASRVDVPRWLLVLSLIVV